jgi:hypothetical protein
MAILNRLKPYGLILFVIVGYALLLLILRATTTLTGSDFISNITIFIGWIVALLIAGIHLSRTRKDNQTAKKEEIRRTLEIDAFREINKAITNFSSLITEVSTAYLSLPHKLKLHLEDPQIFKFNKLEVNLETDQHIVKLLRGVTGFVLTIEANEIAVIKFDHLRKYIQFKIDDVNNSIRDFRAYLATSRTERLVIGPVNSEFENRCREIHEELDTINCYLFDYRIELMNLMLGEIFDSQVPVRKSRDPKYKTLTEVAIKEEVEKEAEEREKKFLEQSRKEEHPSHGVTGKQ